MTPAVATLNHRSRDGLRKEEQAFEVDVHHLVPVGLGDVERVVVRAQTRIVHEDVDLPLVSKHPRHAALDRPLVGDVELDRHRATVPVRHLRDQVRRVIDRPNTGRHDGTGPRQGQHEVVPDPARRPAHDGDLPCQAEIRLLHVH